MTDDALPVRATDPDTSYEAAIKASMGASRVRPVILQILEEHGPLTHNEVVKHYNMRTVMVPGTPTASESGIRTRLSELRKRGLVTRDDADGTSQFGNRAKRWRAVDPQSFVWPGAAAVLASQATDQPVGDMSDVAGDTMGRAGDAHQAQPETTTHPKAA